MKRKLILATVLGIVATWYLTQQFSEEAKIRNRLNELQVGIQKLGGMKGFEKIAQVNSLKQFMTKDIHISAYQGRLTSRGREQLLAYALAIRSEYPEFELSFEDIAIEVGGEGKQASVYMTTLVIGAREWAQAQEMMLMLHKESDVWKIASAVAVETLSLDP